MELQIQLLMSLLKAQKKHIMKSKCLMWLMQMYMGGYSVIVVALLVNVLKMMMEKITKWYFKRLLSDE